MSRRGTRTTGNFRRQAAIRRRAWMPVGLMLTVSGAGCGFDAYAILVPASREACAPIPQGCGPDGSTGLLIPDCPFGLVCFKFACDRHDLCYVECDVTRDVCDDVFADDLLALCVADYAAGDPRLDECLTLAFVYWQAVVRFGGSFFDACCGEATAGAPTLSRVGARSGFARPFDDADDDLLPDAWEQAIGCDPRDAGDALIDADGDGYKNLEEFVHGTDPRDPVSRPATSGR